MERTNLHGGETNRSQMRTWPEWKHAGKFWIGEGSCARSPVAKGKTLSLEGYFLLSSTPFFFSGSHLDHSKLWLILSSIQQWDVVYPANLAWIADMSLLWSGYLLSPDFTLTLSGHVYNSSAGWSSHFFAKEKVWSLCRSARFTKKFFYMTELAGFNGGIKFFLAPKRFS